MKKNRKLQFHAYDYANFFTLSCYAASTTIFPIILVIMAQDLGFPLEGGGLQAAAFLSLGKVSAITVSLVLSCFASIYWGIRKSIIYAICTVVVAIALSAMSSGYWILFVTLLLLGLGEGIIEGLCTPFTQMLHKEDTGRYVNFTHSFWSIGVLCTVTLGGLFLTKGISWRVLLLGVGACYLLPLVGLVRTPAQSKSYAEYADERDGHSNFRTSAQNTWRLIKDIMKIRVFWRYFAAMFLAGGAELSLTFWVASYIQLHFSRTPFVGGIGIAVFSLGMIISRAFWGHAIRQDGLKRLVLYSALVGIFVTVIIPFSQVIWVLMIILLCAGLTVGPYWPSIQSHCVHIMPTKNSTLLFILLSCAGVPGAGFFSMVDGDCG